MWAVVPSAFVFQFFLVVNIEARRERLNIRALQQKLDTNSNALEDADAVVDELLHSLPQAEQKQEKLIREVALAAAAATLSEVASMEHSGNKDALNIRANSTMASKKATAAEEVPTEAPSVVGEWESVGAAFSLVVFAYFLKVICLDLPHAWGVFKRRTAMMDEAAKFEGAVQIMMQRSTGMQDSATRNAELHFFQMYERLRTFVQEVMDQSSLAKADSFIYMPLRDFLKMWVEAFECCTLEPETKPLILCSEAAFGRERGNNVVDLAKAILKESQGKLRDSLADDFTEADRLAKQVEMATKLPVDESDRSSYRFCCGLKVSLCYAFLAVMGASFAVYLHMLNCTRICLVVDVAVFLIFVMMCTGGLIEEGARQEKELNELKDIEDSTGALTMKLEEWERKHNRVAKLWLFQTVNHLSLFDACSSLVKSSVWAAPEHHEKVKNRLVKLNEKLFGAIFNMGPHEMFLKDDGEGDLLFNASEQTTASIAEMKKHSEAGDDGQVGWRIDNLFGLLIIKVIQAHGLSTEYEEDGESEVLTDNYVLLRIADTEREDCLRTATVKGGQSASWDNEFVVETPRDQETFKLELFGSDETAPVGVVDFLVQSAPGRWVSKTDNLKNAESGKAGKLEYAYFFANGLKQLAEIDQKRTNRMQSIMGFLGGTRSMRAGSTLNPVLKGRLSQLVQS